MLPSPFLKGEALPVLSHSQDGDGGRLPSVSRGAGLLVDSETHI